MEGDKKVINVGALKVGNYVIFDNKAYVIRNIQSSKQRHGHVKCRIEAVGLVDGQKVFRVFPAHDKINVPIIEKRTAQILSINEDMANVMDAENYETFNLNIPVKLKDKVIEGNQVIYWIIIGERIMKQVK